MVDRLTIKFVPYTAAHRKQKNENDLFDQEVATKRMVHIPGRESRDLQLNTSRLST